jgi:hypothetical protein
VLPFEGQRQGKPLLMKATAIIEERMAINVTLIITKKK